ncbi:MAG TPA: aromatic amino acid lyase [Candidatus Thalassarchaeaceae archaeon]|nr:MAG TPA: aromatic amino acid lyase [Candidatus Poseidoniales archaeon]HIH82724.1 aromatic amino acid lyase [Candidatus Thalassarchaeaceae archaeon]|tara:strand:+ start:234 stop:1754 length:1521 start_codon:yes stop_codon:yes gene_type:complete
MDLVLDGSHLTIHDVERVAREGDKVSISDEAGERINACREMIQRKIDAHEVMYGVTTGIGEFSEVVLSPEQVLDFQKYLVYSHAAGIGEPMPLEVVRGAMVSRINVHCHGNSGGRLEVTQLLIDMLNQGVTPVVASKGSVGACGDLSPMSQIAMAMMGEGEAFFEGKRMPSADALSSAGLNPIELEARDGLAIINGSNMLTAMAALTLCDALRWLKYHDISAAMTLEALNANLLAFDPRLHELKGFNGSMQVASNILKLTEGSAIVTSTGKKVQDAYSLRSTPQVIGSLKDAMKYAISQVEIELNGVGDNPVFIVDEERVITGANFQGSPVSLPMEMVGIGLSMAAVLSERRLNRLTNPALSGGLPPFLTEKPGLHSGLMVAQYTACALVAETRILSHPAANQSIPAAADQEDFVSMGMTTTQKTRNIMENCFGVLSIEMIASSQALDIRNQKLGKGVAEAHKIIRDSIEHLDNDRPLYPDHNKMVEILLSGAILQAVEGTVGKLD